MHRLFSWLALGAMVFSSAPSHAQKRAPDTTDQGPEIPHHTVSITDEQGVSRVCQEQKAQDFLIRKNWFPSKPSAEESKAARAMFQQSITYRSQNYGRFPGYGSPKDNAKPPASYAKRTKFMGVSIQINERVIPALQCVEAALRAGKLDAEYQPRALSGLRLKNSYRGSEISNHVFGIAIDLDPNENTCCSCVNPWPNHPLCKKKVESIYERMKMPRSWVVVFERYGFYWLGHDTLQDTMHFEFLGDPDQVLKKASP